MLARFSSQSLFAISKSRSTIAPKMFKGWANQVCKCINEWYEQNCKMSTIHGVFQDFTVFRQDITKRSFHFVQVQAGKKRRKKEEKEETDTKLGQSVSMLVFLHGYVPPTFILLFFFFFFLSSFFSPPFSFDLFSPASTCLTGFCLSACIWNNRCTRSRLPVRTFKKVEFLWDLLFLSCREGSHALSSGRSKLHRFYNIKYFY